MNIALALLSGILYALSFPKFNLWWLIFIWPLPLLAALGHCRSWKQALRLGWASGALAFAVTLYWIPLTVLYGGGSLPSAGAAWIALSVYLGLFFGLFACGVHAVRNFKTPFLLVSIPCAWTASEWLRAKLLTGFPWCLSGYALTSSPALLQWAEWGGVWILGFIPMAFAVSLRQSLKNRAAIWGLAACVILAAAFAAGTIRFKQIFSQLRPGAKVALLQGNIAQYEKWDKERAEHIISEYRELAIQAARENPDAIIWPESSWPYLENVSQGLPEAMRRITLAAPGSHLIGAVIEENGLVYNSALLVKEGNLQNRYDKTHLVPFGEFVPFSRWLRPWIKVLSVIGETAPGKNIEPMEISRAGKTAVTICYESIFPEISASLARQSRWLVNLTNDAWYLDTAAPYQHFQMNRVRAVETRLPMARAANTGISAVINPLGSADASSILNEKTVIISTLKEAPEAARNFFLAIQKIFPIACLIWCMGAMVQSICSRFIKGGEKKGKRIRRTSNES